MNIRSKFRCTHFVQHAGYREIPGGREYHFDAVCADEVPENQRFHKATPSGKLSMYVDNAAAAFIPGECYYLDFTQAK